MRLAWSFTFHLFLHPFSVVDDIYLDCRWWFPKQIQNKPFVESILCRWWGRHRGNSKESYRCGNLRWGGNQHAWKLHIENDIVLIYQFFLFLFKVTYATDATTDDCGDAATSYYKEFLYNGKRVIVSNNVQQLLFILISMNWSDPPAQIPDHPAEQDALAPNPNIRCAGWQFVQLEVGLSLSLDQLVGVLK